MAVLTVLLLAAGCAMTPHAWQNPETGAFASVDDIDTCEREAGREAQRSLFLYGWGWSGYGVGWGRGRYAPGMGFGWGMTSANLAVAQRAQELSAFCLRVKGFQWLPVTPATAPPPREPDGKPGQAEP